MTIVITRIALGRTRKKARDMGPIDGSNGPLDFWMAGIGCSPKGRVVAEIQWLPQEGSCRLAGRAS